MRYRIFARTLSHLAWAKDIVVVDSGSTDGTLAVLASLPNVRVFKRNFDSHGNQWRYAVEETQIATDWILRLDADYQVSDALVAEIAALDPNAPVSAYRVSFDYAIFSRKLLSSLYPANTVLLRKGRFSVRDKGHTEAWDVNGPVATLSAAIIHDDWKATGQWLIGQARYMQRELDYLHMDKGGLVALVAAQAAAHAHSGFSLLPVWKGPSFQRPCGNFLRLAAHGSRSRAIPHGARGKVAQSGPSIHRSRPRGALIVGADTSDIEQTTDFAGPRDLRQEWQMTFHQCRFC